MIPVIAIVGRPNVGKSTLFNRLTGSNAALVADHVGLTRDRIYGEGKVGERAFILVDTGGLSGDERGIDAIMAEQALQAIDEADAVLLVTDARAGLTAADRMIADQVRRRHKKAYLVVNKTDGMDPELGMSEFYALGVEPVFAVAAAHNRGVTSLIGAVLAGFPEAQDHAQAPQAGARIAIVGRPNVGKSTLVNRMLGEERVVVYDEPGTTRDSIYIPYTRFGVPYTLIDTAGIRRRKNVTEAIEKFSIIKTLQAIRDANVAIVVFNAREGIVEQDLHMLAFVLEAGRSLVIAINQWDGMTAEAKQQVRQDLERRLGFVDYAPIHFISALHGTAVGDLYPAVDQAYASACAKWQTNRLTRILQQAITEHQPPLVKGRRIKLRYAHQGGSNPPRIVIHGNQTEALPESYKRFLAKRFRKILKISGTPIFFEFKTGENPFAGKKATPGRSTAGRKTRTGSAVKPGGKAKASSKTKANSKTKISSNAKAASKTKPSKSAGRQTPAKGKAGARKRQPASTGK